MKQPWSQKDNYSFHGRTITINCNSQPWIARARELLALSRGCGGDQLIDLTLLDIPAGDVDALLPLPDPQYMVSEVTLLLNEPIPVLTYIQDQQRWQDYAGYGRSWSDRTTGAARVLRFDDNPILPDYASLLFVYNMINYLSSHAGFHEVHASCVDVDGSGILITGNSGRGKSTSVCALLQHGFPVLSDERILLHREGSPFLASSISDMIKIRADAMQRFFPDISADKALFDMAGEYYFKCDTICQNGWKSDVPIKYLLVINQTGRPESRVTPINPSRVVGELFPVTLKPYETPVNMKEKFEFLMDFLQSTPCCQLDFGTDMTAFVETVAAMVRGQNR